MARILIVEDEPHWREVLQSILIGAGYQTAAAEPDEARTRAAAPDCELVLLDLCLDQPEFNLRCEMFLDYLASLAPRVAIIVITGKTLQRGQEFKLSRRGVADFIDKTTLTPEQLRKTVARVLARDEIFKKMRREIQARGKQVAERALMIAEEMAEETVPLTGPEIGKRIHLDWELIQHAIGLLREMSVLAKVGAKGGYELTDEPGRPFARWLVAQI